MFTFDSRSRVGQSQSNCTLTLVQGSAPSTLWSAYQNLSTHGDLPWIFSGVNSLSLIRVAGSVPFTVNFAESSETNTGTIATELFNDIFAVIAGDIVSVVFNATTEAYTVTFSQPYDVLWDQSTCARVFNQFLNEINVSVIQLNAADVGVTEELLFAIGEATSTPISGGIPIGDLIVPTSGSLINVPIAFNENENTFAFTVFRTNIRDIIVPITKEWLLIFSPVQL